MSTFAPDVVAAVLRHMNTDHTADNLDIIRALVDPEADRAELVYLNDRASIWLYSTGATSQGAGEGVEGVEGVAARQQGPEQQEAVWQEAVLPWSQRLTERAQIRREVVELHERAVTLLAEAEPAGTNPSGKDQPKG